MADRSARLLAFHLPQFHPIPENDRWWGDGFTEWTNVRRARPFIPTQRQPRVPADLGYYDLRDASVLEAQAALARRYGIEGFCFWHYWFRGKPLLEQPLHHLLDPASSVRFCMAWANETWSRRWDGHEHEILQAQEYGGDADDRAHLHWLLPYLHSPNAITRNGAPLLLVYRPGDLPDPLRTTTLWREEARASGLPDVHLIAVEGSFGYPRDPREDGFDAALRFQPLFREIFSHPHHWRNWLFSRVPGFWRVRNWTRQHLPLLPIRYDYQWAARVCAAHRDVPYLRYETVFPRWDNTPRKQRRGVVLGPEDPACYGAWLRSEIDAVQSRDPDDRFVFINAWNEWAEGNYLEPDTQTGHRFLEETAGALR